MSLGVVRVFGFFAPIVYIAILTKQYGVSGYGVFATLLAIIGIATQLVDYGYNVYLPKVVAEKKHDEYIFQNVTISRLINTFFVSLILLIYGSISNVSFVSIGIITLYLIIQSFNVSWLLQGREKIKALSVAYIIERTFFIIFVLLLSWLRVDEEYLILASVISCLLMVMVQYFLLSNDEVLIFRFDKLNIKNLTLLYKSAWGYFYSRAAFSAYSNMSVIILGVFFGNHVVGIYSIAEKIYAAIKSMMGIVTTSLYPYMCRTKNISLYCRLVVFILLSATFCISLVYFYSEDVIRFLSNDIKFDDVKVILDIFLLSSLVSLLSMLLGYPLLGAFNFQKIVNRSSLYTFFCYCSFTMLTYFLFEIDAANMAIIVLLSESFCLMYRTFYILINYNEISSSN